MSSERIRELEALLAEEPEDALLRFTLGKELLEAGDAAAAVAHLEHALAVAADYTVAYRYLGTALEQLARRAEAARAWELGIAVADATGDVQAGKEMRVFLQRLRARE